MEKHLNEQSKFTDILTDIQSVAEKHTNVLLLATIEISHAHVSF